MPRIIPEILTPESFAVPKTTQLMTLALHPSSNFIDPQPVLLYVCPTLSTPVFEEFLSLFSLISILLYICKT